MALPYAALPVGLGLKQQLLRATPRRGSLKCRASTNPRKLQISRPRELPSPGGPEDSQHGKGASLMPLAAAQAMLSAGLALLGNPSAAQAAADNIAAAGSSDGTLQTAGLELLLYLAKTLISWGVPGAVGIVLVLLATSRRGQSGSKDKQDDLPPFLKQFMKGSDGAEPREFLKITPLNDRLDSYNYSLTKVTDSKAKAATVRRRKLYEKNFGDILGDLSDEAVEAVLKAEKARQEEAQKAQQRVNDKTRALRAEAISSAPAKSETGVGGVDEGGIGKMLQGMGGSSRKKELEKELVVAVTARAAVDDKFLREISKVLTKGQREKLVKLMEEKTTPGWQDSDSPIALAPVSTQSKKRVFVLKFNGDIQASQARNLREEVTAIIRNAEGGSDEVVLILNTGGGTVTGYGLAAAQLTRIKQAGLKLTICVEQVAASGGYMMACCADRIVASPFAVLGSIGVISEQPNVYDRLKREGIEFQTVTAGKYKRTLTPFKKPTEEDFNKQKEDIEQVLVLFKGFVRQQRPSVNIEDVATGETWFGPDALAKGLVDELKTADDVLLEMLEEGADIYSVAFAPAANPLQQLVASPAGSGGSALGSILTPFLESAISSVLARQLGLYQQQSPDSAVLARDPSNASESVKISDANETTDLWFM